GNRVAAFSRPHRKPIALRNLSVVSAADDSRRATVLLRPVHPVGKPVIRCYSVELSRRLVVPGAPGFPSIQADRRSLIDSQHDSLRVCRIDPNAVIVISTRRAFYRSKRAPAVRRTVQVLRRHIDNVGVLRVYVNLAKVPRPFDPLVLRRFFPCCSRVVGSVQSAFFLLRFHDQIHALSMISRRHRNPRSSPLSFRKSVASNLRPGNALIHILVEPASGPVRCSFLSRLSNAMPQGRVHRARISRLKTKIYCRRDIVFVEDFLPASSSIRRPENSALFVRPGTVAHR